MSPAIAADAFMALLGTPDAVAQPQAAAARSAR